MLFKGASLEALLSPARVAGRALLGRASVGGGEGQDWAGQDWAGQSRAGLGMAGLVTLEISFPPRPPVILLQTTLIYKRV